MIQTQSSAQTAEQPDAIPFPRVAAVQVCAYVVLVAVSACSPLRDLQGAVHVAYTTVPVVAAMALFTWCSSLRDGLAGRVIAAVAGALSLACAVGQSLGALFFPVRATGAEGTEPVGFYPQETWAAGVVGLLVALVLVSFARQMAREDRSHLIRSLSHGVTGGVAMIAAPGWCFLPDLFAACRAADGGPALTVAWAACAVIVVLAVLLAARLVPVGAGREPGGGRRAPVARHRADAGDVPGPGGGRGQPDRDAAGVAGSGRLPLRTPIQTGAWFIPCAPQSLPRRRDSLAPGRRDAPWRPRISFSASATPAQ